jgi:hypothetical protein
LFVFVVCLTGLLLFILSIRRRRAPVKLDRGPSAFDLPLRLGEAVESAVVPTNPTSSATPTYHFTIGKIMIVIGVIAIGLAITANGLAATVMLALAGFYCVVFRQFARSHPLPERRLIRINSAPTWWSANAKSPAEVKSTMDEL